MTELPVLECFLFFSYALAPHMSNSFYLRSARFTVAHVFSLTAAVATALLGWGYGALIWPLFCAYGFYLHLRALRGELQTLAGAASCISFVFSLISSLWFVSGINDLHLLGYNRVWSFYAALHGSVLGWLFLGCTAHLGIRSNNRSFIVACFVASILFLMVAFGINGIPYAKRIGVIGFSVLVPTVIVRFASQARGMARHLGLVSLAAIAASMGLALANEFWSAFPRGLLGMPSMVLTHGALNTFVVLPAFYLAIRSERDQKGALTRSKSRPPGTI